MEYLKRSTLLILPVHTLNTLLYSWSPYVYVYAYIKGAKKPFQSSMEEWYLFYTAMQIVLIYVFLMHKQFCFFWDIQYVQ